jgi:uncharacterized repeat protein (TIGR01451 family)
MKGLAVVTRGRRNLTVALLTLAGVMTFLVAGALADAGNPILGTIKATAVDNGTTVTVSVKGEWNWLSHNSDCNDDRAGTGVGIIWSDPTEPGWTVTKNLISADIGIKTLRGVNDGANTIDREVHPADIGNVPADGHGPLPGKAGQVLVDPAPDPVTGLGNVAAWRGGCGREPVDGGITPLAASPGGATELGNTVTLTSSDPNGFVGYAVGHTIKVTGVANNNYNGTFTVSAVLSNTQIQYTSGKVGLTPSGGGSVENTTNANAGGCLEYCGHPWGSWGYQKTYSHTYEKIQSVGPNAGQSGLPSRVCVNFYDVHGNDAGQPVGGEPNAAKEIQVDGNGDNSIQTNSFDVSEGRNCITLISPTLTTAATDARVGNSVSDTATLSGLPANAGGTITFEAYGPRNAANTPNPDCSGAAVYTSTIAVAGPNNYNSANGNGGAFTPGAVGKYDWKVHYSGDSNNLVLSADSACGAATTKEISTIVDARIHISPSQTNRVGQPHTFTAFVEKNLGDGNGWVAAANQPVTVTLTNGNGAHFNVSSNTCPAGTAADGKCAITFTSPDTGTVTGNASATVSNLGVPAFTVATSTGGQNGTDAVKTFVDARIHISPSATNRVGQPHTFTVLVEKDLGDGAGWVAAANQPVTVTLTNGNGAHFNVSSNTCPAGTAADGKCAVTFTSPDTGTVTGHASASLANLGTVQPVTVATSTGGQNGADAVKTFVDARIHISQSATNRVNQNHTFTVFVEKDLGDGAGFVAAANQAVTVTLTNGNGAHFNVSNNTCPGGTGLDGKCAITFTSPDTGTVTGNASASLANLGTAQPVVVATSTGGQNGTDAVKTFVDARIHISPSATNRVGQPHTFTVFVEKDLGDGAGFVAAANQAVTVTLTNGNNAHFATSSNTCPGGTGLDGKCAITFTSPDTGTVTGHASASLANLGTAQPVVVTTSTGGQNGTDAVKTFVDARIQISPSATNRVGEPHTFTVFVEKDLGNGAGFVAAANQPVTVTLTNGNNAHFAVSSNTCTANTGADGKCAITFTSPDPGTVTGHASASLANLGTAQPVTVATSTGGQNGTDAVKVFVDANIQITPANATNPLSTNHVLTGHVNVNLGAGGGYVNAPNGTTINFTIVSGPGSFVGPTSCLTSGGTGSCTVTITSSTSGVTKVRATTDVSVGGLVLHRATGDANLGDSADATKVWASAKIEIGPSATNEIGQPHTFTVTLSKDTGTNAFVAAAGEHADFTLTDSNGATHGAPTGTCTNAGANTNANGQCTITFTSNSPGTVTAHATSTLIVSGTSITVSTSGAGTSGDAVKTFVDANIQITPPTAINPVSTNHVLTAHVNVNVGGTSFANAPDGTQISFTIDSGPGSLTTANPCTTAGGTGSCSVTLTSATPGTTIVSAHVTLVVGGVTLKRDTNGTAANSGAATKLFADDTVRTDILNAAQNVVTTVVAGTIVHDKVFVARSATTPAAVPNPTGSVIFHRYATIDCTGAATNQTVALTPGSPSTALSDDFAPTANMSYNAEYLGDANYPARTGVCEPLTVTPAPAPAIAIVKNPKSQTVAVGGTATFTITVTNAGNTVLTDVNVVDPLSPNCNRTKADIPALASMAPGATVTYSCTRPNVRASFDNVATAIGTPPSGPNVTASDTAPVKAQALTPTKKTVVKKKKPKVVSHKKPKATG